jgi:transcriptional regulator with XRE-family HTH domain
MSTFGQYLKQKRIEREMPLREFCIAASVDPGNYSKYERGLLAFPTKGPVPEQIRKALGMDVDGDEWREIQMLADLDRGEIPKRILSDSELVGKLPILFRTLEGGPVTDKTFEDIITLIRKEYSPVTDNTTLDIHRDWTESTGDPGEV